MWIFNNLIPKEQSGIDGRTFDIENLKIQVRNAIAEGGFSSVYLARDCYSGKQYALKHIICNDGESMDLVKKEIEVMKLLKGHPNVVTLYAHSILDFGRTKEAFLVMEYCEKSLVSVLESKGAGFFEEKQILLIFRDVCNAVFAMHSHLPPIAHRDLKAENVLLGPEEAWKLCDFGSTSTQHKRYERPEEMGIEEDNIRKHTTPAYRAPEMWDLFRKELINEKVDIWALGCLLYRICYLKSAFDGESKLQVLNVNYRIPDLPRYSTSVKDLIRDMLQAAPDARPDIMQARDLLDWTFISIVVWRRVNEQLPIELQKHAPDKPASLTEKLPYSDGKDNGIPTQSRRTSLTPSRAPPPPPSSKEQIYSSTSTQDAPKSTGSSSQFGSFWSTLHAQETNVSDENGPKFDKDPNDDKIRESSRQIRESSHHTVNGISPPKEVHQRARHRVTNAHNNTNKKIVEGPSEGYEIRFFSGNTDCISDASSTSSLTSNKAGKSETLGTPSSEMFGSFTAEFDCNKLNLENERLKKEELHAEAEKLREELKQVAKEKAEITAKYEKLMAICRSQRQEIQELKQVVASGGSVKKNCSSDTATSQLQAPQSQKPSGSWQANTLRLEDFFSQIT
ncbi:putative serine/threonine-protein kinase [Nymphaea thermarum]|nr:putative serine/threonine-protein kinase [Nymphaea thermarum]